MIPVTTFARRKVALFGLGGSGLASARALHAGRAEVVAFDDDPKKLAQANAEGIFTADLRHIDWSGIAALLLAPGVPLTHPAPHWTVGIARNAAVEVIGDIELFCRERCKLAPDAPFVAITGTNGKSTTTALVAHLFASANYDVQLGGNIGTAILSLEPPAPRRALCRGRPGDAGRRRNGARGGSDRRHRLAARAAQCAECRLRDRRGARARPVGRGDPAGPRVVSRPRASDGAGRPQGRRA